MIEVQRREFKYPIQMEQMCRMKQRLSPIMRSDSHNGADGYRVRSLYFDTLEDTDFWEKVDGYDSRRKIRLRIYDGNYDVIKLEVKTKQNDMQVKYSLILSKEEAFSMIQGDYSFLLSREEKIAKQIYTRMALFCYKPKCIVEYDRYAYFCENNDIRVTFDQNLRATESNMNIFDRNLKLYPVCDRNHITMEVKYNGFLFSYIKEELASLDIQQESNSKYCHARMISMNGRI